MPEEIWKDIEGYEGLYQISNHGRIKSFLESKSGKILSATNKTGWYVSVRLAKNGALKTGRIHKLVAGAFIPNPTHGSEIHHIDGNRQNNRADNLMWITHKEHMLLTVRENPGNVRGMNNYNKNKGSKAVTQYSLDGRYIATFNGCKEASATTGVCSRNIYQVASKTEYKPSMTRKQAGGFVWEFGAAVVNGD